MQKMKRLLRSEYIGEEITTRMTWENGQWNPENEFIPNRVSNSQISKRAVVIGNGNSRENYELFLLKNHRAGLLGSLALQTYGCNALYRDFRPTFLIATGPTICAEIANTENYCAENIVYANAEIVAKHPGKFYLLPQDLHYNAGALAAYMACFDGHETVYLMGFDGTDGNDHGHNIYRDTNGYSDETNPQSDRLWIKTLLLIMETYSNVEFVRVQPTPGWQCPEEWLARDNFRQISYKAFVLEADL
jgi:hypothetical protein